MDIASGRGILLRQLLKLDLEQIIATDVDPNILLYDRRSFLNQSKKNILTVATDAKLLAIQNNSVDFVVTLAGLNNIPNPTKAYEEIYRILRTGGKLFALNVFVEENSDTFKQVKQFNYDRALSQRIIKQDLEAQGFKVDIEIISDVKWLKHPMDGFPLDGDMKYYAIITAVKN